MKTNHDILAGAFPETPQGIDHAIGRAVANIRAEERKAYAQRGRRVFALVLVIVLLLGAVAYAVYEGLTADIFGWFYGGNWQQELQAGDQAIMRQSKQLGDVVYTIEDVIYKKDGDFPGLYGTIRIRPAEGSNIVLIANDTSVHELAGYSLHLGTEQAIPDDVPTYAELAQERKAKILTAKASIISVSIDGKECPGSFGEIWLPQPDGSLIGTMEMTDNMRRAEQYELVLNIANWEVTLDDKYLREEPNNTWLKEEWHVTVQPTMKEEK
ncbi:MAG: hypothetical protein RR672_12425 [Raoultibacter sp.]